MKKKQKFTTSILLVFMALCLTSCAQPAIEKPVNVTFYLGDNMNPEYSLGYIESHKIDIETGLNKKYFNSEELKTTVTNRDNKISFQYLIGEHLVLELKEKNESMIIHFITNNRNIWLGNQTLKLGKIPFQNGHFIFNTNILSDTLLNWKNIKLYPQDSLHYYNIVRDKKANRLIGYVIYSKNIEEVGYTTYFDNNKIQTFSYQGNRATEKLHKEYYEDYKYAAPKFYTSYYEHIELDSTGIVKNRVIYNRNSDNFGVENYYQQKHQIGKHFLEIQNTLPAGLLSEFNITKIYDKFMSSPIIQRAPYAIQISNVGYFPQDTIDINKFMAYEDSIVLKVSFNSGADKIGKPIINRKVNGNEILYQIYIIETKASYELEWARKVLIPLKIEDNKTYKIEFPLVANESLLLPEEYDYAPRWQILSGLYHQTDSPLIIKGTK